MASGVKVSDDVFAQYQEMKMKKKHRYMTMKIEEGYIVRKDMIEKSDNQREDFDNLLANLSKTDACYILLDMTVTAKSGAEKPVLFIITWCPDCGKTKDKMLYASSKQALLLKIREGTKNVQVNDITDLDYQELLDLGAS